MAKTTKQQDYLALDWVKVEIEQTLKQTQQALETFAETPQDGTALSFCQAYVHQIKGSLLMVEAHRLVAFADEMEQLVKALQADSTQDIDETLQVLMEAVLQLPIWLAQLSESSEASFHTLTLLNQLRAARGQPPLSEEAKEPSKRPVLAPLAAEVLRERDSKQLGERLQRMRLTLQKALPSIVREQNLQTHLNYLERVFSALEKLCKNAPLYPLWQTASVLVEALKADAINPTPSLHLLLRKLDHELKSLIKNGIEGINQTPPEELLNDLLLTLAQVNEDLPLLNKLKVEYDLEPDEVQGEPQEIEERSLRSSPDALRAVVTALCEDLLWVKDELDLFVRSHTHNAAALSSLLSPLKQVEGTLAVLSFSQLQKTIFAQIELLQSLIEGQQKVEDGLLLDMAGALLYVETSLTGMIAQSKTEEELQLPEISPLPQAQQLVLQEARTLLAQVKDAFIQFIADNWQREHLENVPDLLHKVSGALNIASFEQASRLLSACARYVHERLLAYGQVPPDWQSLDRLADAISGVEYYLERLRLAPAQPNQSILELAEQSLQALGYLVEADETKTPIEQPNGLFFNQQKPVSALASHTEQQGSAATTLQGEADADTS